MKMKNNPSENAIKSEINAKLNNLINLISMKQQILKELNTKSSKC